MSHRITTKILTPMIGCFVMLIATASISEAAVIEYLLSNHQYGNARPPTYGFRLDNLQDNGFDYTFSFDDVGAEMILRYDDVAQTINISGRAFGGRDDGTTYDTNNSGFFDIDFTYRVGVTTSTSPDGLLVVGDDDLNTGTIQYVTGSGNWSDTQNLYNLTDYKGGHANSFLFLADGHRIPGDNTTMVGRGWVNHDGDGDLTVHDSASDWLFTGVRRTPDQGVPEPTAILIWGSLALFGAVNIRRRS